MRNAVLETVYPNVVAVVTRAKEITGRYWCCLTPIGFP